jgi:hypothetical protein
MPSPTHVADRQMNNLSLFLSIVYGKAPHNHIDKFVGAIIPLLTEYPPASGCPTALSVASKELSWPVVLSQASSF